MKKLFLALLDVVYSVYNTFAILILVFLFITQKTWIARGNKRVYKSI